VLPGSDTWKQALIRPGEHPLRELNEAMAAAGEHDRILVAVDQFEETFTTCEDEAERAAFLAELAHIADERDGRGVVVIALRADFYGRCAAYPELAGLLASNHVLVGSMQRDELRRAIELPARRVGLRVDTELADALVADVKDEPGALPLLSTALLELWQRRDGRRLRHAVYEQTGGVHGAVARLAEDAFRKLDDEQQVIARGVLMRLAGEGAAGGVERRRVALTDLETERNEEVGRVVALLTDRRLLTVSSGTVELAHEALMREWPRLRDWIDADREGLRIHRNLNAAAREWEQLGRDEGALYRGARLTEAIEWNAAQQPRLNDNERAFLAASDARREHEQAARRRRLRLSFSAMTIALAAITIVAIVAIYQRRETERERQIGASREIAVSATSLLDADPGLSLGLALEALKRWNTKQAQNALRQATLEARGTAVLAAHDGWLNAAVPSRDGRSVATGGQDGTVRVWNLGHRRVVATIRGHHEDVYDTSLSPDGGRVASVGRDGVVAIARADGRRRHVLRHFRDAFATSVEFIPDGRRLVVGVSDGTVRLLPIDGPGKGVVLGRHGGFVYEARLNRDGTKVVSANADQATRIWDIKHGTSVSLAHPADVTSASFSPNGRRVATAGSDGKVRIWASDGRGPLKTMSDGEQPLLSVRYSPDGRRLLTAGEDGLLRLWDVRSATVLDVLKGHQGMALQAEFVPHSDAILSAGEDGTLRTWAPLPTVVLHGDVNGVSFSRDGRYLASGGTSGVAHVWDLKTGASWKLPGQHDTSVARFWTAGPRIVTASFDGIVRVWSRRGGGWHSDRVPVATWEKWAAALDPAGRLVTMGGETPRLVIQRPRGGHPTVLSGHRHRVLDVAFSPDGRSLLSASADGTARIWNVADGKLEQVLRGHDEAVESAAFSSDGRRVVTASADGTVRVWHVGDDRSVIMHGHAGQVLSARFNHDGDRVVSAGQDGTIRVWDAAGGEALVVLQKHEGPASGADFGPGQRVASAGADGIVQITPCEVCGSLATVLRLARTRADRELSATERQRFLPADG
jgi:WD40 repeat protein